MKSILLFRLLFLGAISFLTFSCNNEEKKTNSALKEPQTVKTDSAETVIPDTIHTKFNQIAKLIGGIDSVPAFLPNLKNSKAFLNLYKSKQSKFNRIESLRLSKLNYWFSELLKKENLPDSNFCFYPFAGGDFIHAHYLYPNANDYLLFALEPTGSLPNFHNKNEDEILDYLNNLDTVLRDIYLNSYFITKNMNEDIRKKNMIDGVLPLIIWGSSRAGYDISSIRHFDIDSSGNKVFKNGNEADLGKSKAVYIELLKNGKKKSITYISGDVSDEGLKKYPGLKIYLEKAVPDKKTTTFIKSASYLLHLDMFLQMRNLVLNKSSIVIQDDTGVPYRFINDKVWNIKLFGEYKPPVKDFSRKLFQNDLDSAYNNKINYAGTLSFSIGYHWNNGYQSQMFYYRKK
jgi:hypothetical protein